MSIRSEAEENLRVIRSLMEKATVYRALSAPAALVGGVCSVAVAIMGWWFAQPWYAKLSDWAVFVAPWLGVLAVTGALNLWLLWRDARRRSEPFFSQGMRLALRAMMPALFGGAACILLVPDRDWPTLATLWVIFYGVSLMAAAHFAPKAINWLGRAFFAAGILLALAGGTLFHLWQGTNPIATAHVIMGSTFGLLHLIYAGATWARPVKS